MSDFSEGGIFWGIDESNHGKYPEFYVKVSSNIREDTNNKENLGKKRKKVPSIANILGEERHFEYILFPKEYTEFFYTWQMKTIVLAEFLKKNKSVKPSKIYFDGDAQDKIIRQGLELVLPEEVNIPKIYFLPKADITLPIVNYADAIANFLFKNFKSHNPKDYFDHIITPSIEEYKILRELSEY